MGGVSLREVSVSGGSTVVGAMAANRSLTQS